jgi:uncharacterized membrane protein
MQTLFGNIKIAELRNGDVLHVFIEANDEGVPMAYITSIDTAVQRYPIMICLLLLAVIVVIVCARKEGAKAVTVAILASVLVFMFLVPAFMMKPQDPIMHIDDALVELQSVAKEGQEEYIATIAENMGDYLTALSESAGASYLTNVNTALQNLKNTELEFMQKVAVKEIGDTVSQIQNKGLDNVRANLEKADTTGEFFAVIFASLLIMFAIIVMREEKLNKKIAISFVCASIVMLCAIAVLYGFDLLSKTSGNNFEAAVLAENIMQSNVNFHLIFISTVVMAMSAVVAIVAHETVTMLDKNKGEIDSKNENALTLRKSIADKVCVVVTMLLGMIIPRYLLLVAYKYPLIEIANSEILIDELSRIAVIVIALCLVSQVTAFVGSIFYPKVERLDVAKN